LSFWGSIYGRLPNSDCSIGQFVLHCHILDHEDAGMMQNVIINIPDGKGEPPTPTTDTAEEPFGE
jgi:hypothetical protein